MKCRLCGEPGRRYPLLIGGETVNAVFCRTHAEQLLKPTFIEERAPQTPPLRLVAPQKSV